jgi:hypothetical protein
MKYDDLLKYAEKLTADTMKILAARFMPWKFKRAVIGQMSSSNHEQITELAEISDTSKSVAPNVKKQ